MTSQFTRMLRIYRPDRVAWRWFAGAAYLDGVKRNDGTWSQPATRDYEPSEFIWPPRTLREEIRRDIGDIQREIRERRAQREPAAEDTTD